MMTTLNKIPFATEGTEKDKLTQQIISEKSGL